MKTKISVLAFLLVFSSCSIFKTSQTITEKNTEVKFYLEVLILINQKTDDWKTDN